MKKLIFLVVYFCGFTTAYSQVNLTIQQYDSLKKVQVVLAEKNQYLQDSILNLATRCTQDSKEANDSITNLHKSYKAELRKLVTEKEKLNKELKTANKKAADLQKNKIIIERDSLHYLVNRIKADNLKLNDKLLEKDNEITSVQKHGEQKALLEKENGKREALANIIDVYKTKPFDDLIKFSNKESIMRDLSLVGNNTEIAVILNDLHNYFEAKEQLTKKFDADQIKKTQIKLNQINQKSILLDKLKKDIGNYQKFNDGLKVMLKKLNKIDEEIQGENMDEETRNIKITQIMSEISSYIFSYDSNFTDYPYLTDIVLEIIKSKQPNTDADVTYLLRKL